MEVLLAVVCMLSLPWLLLVHGQSSAGFINIACGRDQVDDVVDHSTQLTYNSDYNKIDAGEIHPVPDSYEDSKSYSPQLLDLRSFPNGTRNCYSLNQVLKGQKYLARALFLYANYDNKNYLPKFDLYMGVNKWQTIAICNASLVHKAEIMTVATSNSITVCLVNTGAGTPFISALELRPLPSALYKDMLVDSLSFVLVNRSYYGNDICRYQCDDYDRWWDAGIPPDGWKTKKTNLSIVTDNIYLPPSSVLQTAVYTNDSSPLAFTYSVHDLQLPSPRFYGILHFAEVEVLNSNDSRIFDITGDLEQKSVKPNYARGLSVPSKTPKEKDDWTIAFTITKSEGSTLPPILNAMEWFVVINNTQLETDDTDVDAIMEIRAKYSIKRNWMGDPCAPPEFKWNGVTCKPADSGGLRIIGLNLSGAGLTKGIIDAFTKLTQLQDLDLSRNSLEGKIPEALDTLQHLKTLDLSGNKINESIPNDLLEKARSGILCLRTETCIGCDTCIDKQTGRTAGHKIIAISVPLACVMVILFIISAVWIMRRKQAGNMNCWSIRSSPRTGSFKAPSFLNGNRQFSYTDLVRITNNFEREIGKGGSGAVYYGLLENQFQVAVKLLSPVSGRGLKEFQTEANFLCKIHHRYLVPLVGYCIQDDHLAIVCGYMAQGNLMDHLSGKGYDTRIYSWKERIRIAAEAAQGLEYLHKGCKPAIVHRDVKTSNILLNQDMEVRIADFGLSKFQNDGHSHVTTIIAGTPGYIDPQYSNSNKLNERSDIYSFGIVLLELITGLPAIIKSKNGMHLLEWVKQSLQSGDLTEVVDRRLQGGFEINSMWKTIDTAIECTSAIASERPSMTVVLMQLNECLELEMVRERSRTSSKANLGTSCSTSMEMAPLRDTNIEKPSAR